MYGPLRKFAKEGDATLCLCICGFDQSLIVRSLMFLPII